MRCVSLTAMNPTLVLSATAQSTEWTVTKTRLGMPSPNHSMASGSSEIAGSGWNMAVSVPRMSRPIRVETARTRNTAAAARPAAYPSRRTSTEIHTFRNRVPLASAFHIAAMVEVKVGKSSGSGAAMTV